MQGFTGRHDRSRSGTIVGVAAALCLFSGASASAYNCSATTHKAAYDRMNLAFIAGILAQNKGRSTSVLISDLYWSRMTLAQKTEFAEALVCAVAGVGKGTYSWTFRSIMTGKVVGEWKIGTVTVP